MVCPSTPFNIAVETETMTHDGMLTFDVYKGKNVGKKALVTAGFLWTPDERVLEATFTLNAPLQGIQVGSARFKHSEFDMLSVLMSHQDTIVTIGQTSLDTMILPSLPPEAVSLIGSQMDLWVSQRLFQQHLSGQI